ncbi:6120_t:CDS:1, partial [Cetraspora pellucida]
QEITKLINEEHHLQYHLDSSYNYAAKASCINVVKTINLVKKQAQCTYVLLAQLIQNITVNCF